MEDTIKHKGMRRGMVRELQEKGITDTAVLEAMNLVPRHLFIDSAFLSHAYQNKPFAIGEGQTISQPFTVAWQTELLSLRPGDKILEIGTGSGYQCAVLCAMGVNVYSIECIRPLYNKAKKVLAALGFTPRLFCADGTKGLELYAPFDKIIVTAGAPNLPKKLLAQLAANGRMVVPVGSERQQEMLLLEKNSKGELFQSAHGQFSFVKLTGETGWKS